ncbi:hypothetical protein ACFQS7_13755 [Dankookia sp. GCM10030260]
MHSFQWADKWAGFHSGFPDLWAASGGAPQVDRYPVPTMLPETGLDATPAALTFSYTGALQTYTVPATGTYNIVATGASGGTANAREGGSDAAVGGFGAQIEGIFTLTAGDVLAIAVGGRGDDTPDSIGSGGGGGGSFVVDANGSPLLIAGGGGGGSVGGNSSQHRGISATGLAAANGHETGFPTADGGKAGSDGQGGEGGKTDSEDGDGYAGGGGGGLATSGGDGEVAVNAGGGGGAYAEGLTGGAGGAGNGGAGGYGGGGGGGYLGGGGGGGGYSGGGGGGAAHDDAGGGGNGASFTSLAASSFGTSTASGNGLVVITPLSEDGLSAGPIPGEGEAAAGQHHAAGHCGMGHWFL